MNEMNITQSKENAILEITGASEATKEQAEQLIKQAIPQKKPEKEKSPEISPIIPDGFVMRHKSEVQKFLIEFPEGKKEIMPIELKAGLWLKSERARVRDFKHADNGKKLNGKMEFPHWICPAFKVTAEINNQKRTDRALLFEWKDQWGTPHQKEFRPGKLHQNKEKSNLFSELTQSGLTIPTDKNRRQAFQDFSENTSSKKCLTRFERVGWNRLGEIDFYALSDGNSYPKDESIYVPDLSNGNSLYEQKGTLQEWKDKVATYADENKMLALGISLSFAGSLLKLANMEGGGINLIGNSQCGKSTALKMAASVWGEPSRSGQVQTWRTTDNALELTAEKVNDGVLFIDEMQEANDKALSKAAYMLANGRGKARYTDGKLITWRLLFLSTGESPLKDLIERQGGKSNAGQEVRITDIQADNGTYGVFDTKYKFNSGGEFADHLTTSLSENYGTAGDEWLKELVKQDLKALKKRINSDMRDFIEISYPEIEKRGQITTVLKRFAICAIAGELATEWKILPWEKGTATRLILSVAKDWLSERGTGSLEELRIFAELKTIIDMNEDRFQLVSEDLAPRERLGWKRFEDGGLVYFLLPSGLRDIFMGEHKQAIKILLDKEILEPAKSVKLRTGLSKYVYTLTQLGQSKL
ncbi:DUF927 domain-containing protein [Acetobacteraceae bacterium]|nr:DUF927 domain-containing protein [Acetobacteraceae bacterium]